MKHEPGIFEQGDDLDRLIASLPCPPGIKHIDDPDDEEIDAEADIAAGRGYPHAVVGEWLKTWGKPGCKSFHDWLEESKR